METAVSEKWSVTWPLFDSIKIFAFMSGRCICDYVKNLK